MKRVLTVSAALVAGCAAPPSARYQPGDETCTTEAFGRWVTGKCVDGTCVPPKCEIDSDCRYGRCGRVTGAYADGGTDCFMEPSHGYNPPWSYPPDGGYVRSDASTGDAALTDASNGDASVLDGGSADAQ